MWTNPRTGTKKFCSARTSTILLSINLSSLEIQSQKTLDDEQVAALRKDGKHLYAAINFKTNCHLETNFKLAEFGPGFDFKSLFETSSVNSIEVKDLLITPNHFIFAGDLRTFLPSALTTEIWSLEKLSNYKGEDPFAESFWEKQEDVGNGFVLVIHRDGKPLADKVFPDQLNRSISNVVPMEDNRFIAVGTAIGNRGWAFSFNLKGPNLSLEEHFSSWLRRISVSFRKLVWD